MSKATGRQLRAEQMPADLSDVGRQRTITDIVLAINEGLPVLVTYNTDLAVAYGYHIHSMSLLLRDYQHPGQTEVRIPSTDAKLQGPVVFLQSLGDPLPPQDALEAGLTLALDNSDRPGEDGFLYGLEALSAWRDDLLAYDTYTQQERELLFLCNWWTLLHLYDARQAAVEYLDNARLLEGEGKQWLLENAGTLPTGSAAPGHLR